MDTANRIVEGREKKVGGGELGKSQIYVMEGS